MNCFCVCSRIHVVQASANKVHVLCFFRNIVLRKPCLLWGTVFVFFFFPLGRLCNLLFFSLASRKFKFKINTQSWLLYLFLVVLILCFFCSNLIMHRYNARTFSELPHQTAHILSRTLTIVFNYVRRLARSH